MNAKTAKLLRKRTALAAEGAVAPFKRINRKAKMHYDLLPKDKRRHFFKQEVRLDLETCPK